MTKYTPLGLTTPYTASPAVKDLQQALKDHGWLTGAVDGVYGPDTEGSVARAKYWMGYRTENVHKGGADQWFRQYLSGERKKRPDMLVRRKARLKQASATPKRILLLRKAQSQLGVHESPPDSNNVLYSRWYGMIGAWCAMFISWCAAGVGLHFHYSYVPDVVYYARNRRYGLRTVDWANVLPGHIACYDWNGDGVADHIGIVESKQSGSSFYAIEGNTAIGNDSNGGEVMRRTRYLSNVLAFVEIT